MTTVFIKILFSNLIVKYQKTKQVSLKYIKYWNKVVLVFFTYIMFVSIFFDILWGILFWHSFLKLNSHNHKKII